MEYHPTVNKIKELLDKYGCQYKCFEHEAVRTSKEAALVRPEYSISQGAKALIVRVKVKGISKEEVKKFEEFSPEVANSSDVREGGDNLDSFYKEKQFVQIVVPGDVKFNPKKARQELNVKDIRFATPEEVAEITDGVIPGGVPPFGNLWGLPVYVEKALLENEEVIFNAGDQKFSIVMKTDDYIKTVKPILVSIV